MVEAMSLTKIKETAAELRFAGNVARTENARSKRGPVGTWKAHLAIAGLSGERRE